VILSGAFAGLAAAPNLLPRRSESFLLAIRRRQGKAISAAADADAEDVFVARKRNLVCEEIESTGPLTLELPATRSWLLGANKHQNIGILHSSIRLILGRQFVRGITMR
jgi:hypothetical protein